MYIHLTPPVTLAEGKLMVDERRRARRTFETGVQQIGPTDVLPPVGYPPSTAAPFRSAQQTFSPLC